MFLTGRSSRSFKTDLKTLAGDGRRNRHMNTPGNLVKQPKLSKYEVAEPPRRTSKHKNVRIRKLRLPELKRENRFKKKPEIT